MLYDCIMETWKYNVNLTPVAKNVSKICIATLVGQYSGTVYYKVRFARYGAATELGEVAGI